MANDARYAKDQQQNEELNDHRFQVKNFVSLIQNDNETDTIVYTSKEFQPLADTFSGRYAFVGPSIREYVPQQPEETDNKQIYISLGTVLNSNPVFYRNCLQAFTSMNYRVVMSVGEKTDLSSFGDVPQNFTIDYSIDQIAVLQRADVFLAHCGMNSVNESLYFGVPMVLFPQHSEQRMVADRVAELGAGIFLKGTKPKELKKAVDEVFEHSSYRKNTERLSEIFKATGGAAEAALVILNVLEEKRI